MTATVTEPAITDPVETPEYTAGPSKQSKSAKREANSSSDKKARATQSEHVKSILPLPKESPPATDSSHTAAPSILFTYARTISALPSCHSHRTTPLLRTSIVSATMPAPDATSSLPFRPAKNMPTAAEQPALPDPPDTAHAPTPTVLERVEEERERRAKILKRSIARKERRAKNRVLKDEVILKSQLKNLKVKMTRILKEEERQMRAMQAEVNEMEMVLGAKKREMAARKAQLTVTRRQLATSVSEAEEALL